MLYSTIYVISLLTSNNFYFWGLLKIDFKEIEGKEVICGEARFLGKVCGVEIDTKDWKVTYICLDVDKNIVEDLGLIKSRFGSVKVFIPTEKIDATSDRIILGESVEELRKIVKLKL